MHNKKLHVHHGLFRWKTSRQEEGCGEDGYLSQQQIYGEISNLRRKYNELGTFSVNLTALQNPLDQIKVELNRINHSRHLICPMVVTNIGGMGMIQVLEVALAAFVMEYFMGKLGLMIVFERVPLVGDYLLPLLQYVFLCL